MFDKILEQLANFVLQWLEKQAGMWLQTEIMQLLGITKQATQQTAQTTAVIAAQTAQTTAITAAQTAQTAGHRRGACYAGRFKCRNRDRRCSRSSGEYHGLLYAHRSSSGARARRRGIRGDRSLRRFSSLRARRHHRGEWSRSYHGACRWKEFLSAPQTQNFERLVNQPQGGGHSTTLNYSPNINACL